MNSSAAQPLTQLHAAIDEESNLKSAALTADSSEDHPETCLQTPQTAPEVQRGPVPALFIRKVSFRDAHIEHVMSPGGVVERFVILRTAKLRKALGQPRRRRIDPLHARQEHFELRTSELWAQAEADADRSLRRLYERITELHQPAADNAPPVSRKARAVGKLLPLIKSEEDTQGVLVQLGAGFIDLLQQSGTVVRMEGIDLMRALEVSGAKLFESIRVLPQQRHTVAIHEERTGRAGDTNRVLRRSRSVYQIIRDRPSAQGNDAEGLG